MPRSLHVEIVTETWAPDVNGVALAVRMLADGLRAQGHRVGMVRIARGAEPAGEDRGELRVHGSPVPGYPGLRFGLPAAGRLRARWNATRPDAVYIATEGPLGWSALNVANQLGIPAATGFHTRFDDYAAQYGARVLSPWVLAWMRRFHNRGDATLVPTAELERQLQDKGFTRLRRLGRAVDTTAFHPRWRSTGLRMEWGAQVGAPVLLAVGRLAAEKNLDLAIAGFRELQSCRPGTRLVLVGDGPERARLQGANPDIVFTGVLQGARLSAAFASADMFVFPSLTETFGNVMLEAMASALPCVAFDYGAAGEHLWNGDHGASVPFGDAEGFVQAVSRVGTLPDLAQRGAAARRAVQGLDPGDVARDFADLLGGLCAPRAAA